jgi:hypothetical protein
MELSYRRVLVLHDILHKSGSREECPSWREMPQALPYARRLSPLEDMAGWHDFGNFFLKVNFLFYRKFANQRTGPMGFLSVTMLFAWLFYCSCKCETTQSTGQSKSAIFETVNFLFGMTESNESNRKTGWRASV